MNIKNTASFAYGPIINAALGIVSVPLLAWMFTPEDIGRLNIFYLTLTFSLIFSALGLDIAYVREFHDTVNKMALLKACFMPGFSLLAALAIGLIIFSEQITKWLFGISDSRIFLLTLIGIFVNFFLRFLTLTLRMHELGLSFSAIQITPKLLQLAFCGLVLWLGVERLFPTLLGITVASISIALALHSWKMRKFWVPAVNETPSAAGMQTLLKFGLPLTLSGLAYWGLTATSTIVLGSKSTLHELGIYSVSASFANAAGLFQSIFTAIWAPTVFKWASQDLDMSRVNYMARKVLVLIGFIFATVGVFSFSVDFLLPSTYFNVKYFLVCAIAPSLLYMLSEVTGIGIAISRRTQFALFATLAALASNFIISLWLVPTHGALGAIVANAIAYTVFFIARSESSARIWLRFPRRQIYPYVLSFVILAISTAWLGPSLPINHSILWFFIFLVLCFCFQHEICQFSSAFITRLRRHKFLFFK